MNSPVKRVAVFDIETGGLNAKTAALTEIAIVMLDFETLEEVGRYESMVLPYDGVEYDQKALDYSQITIEQLEEEGKPLAEVIEGIEDFVHDHRIGSSKPTLCGHNIIKFDIPHLEKAFERVGRKIKQCFDLDYAFDTLKMCETRMLYANAHTLGACCAEFGIIIVQAHRAMHDTVGNAQLAIELWKTERSMGGSAQKKKERARVNFEF